jgi:hypothetical protein
MEGSESGAKLMTTNAWIEVAVSVEWEWVDDSVSILNVSTKEPKVESADLAKALTPKQIEELEEDCRTDWVKQMKNDG